MIPLSNEMREFHADLKKQAPFMLGYPGNLNNDFSELYRFFDFIINNVADPCDTGASYTMHSKKYEQQVLNFFRDLYKFDRETSWGYTTNGGTEGNAMGLLMAKLKNPRSLKVFSTNGHYSIQKNAKIMNLEYVEIKMSKSGEMNYQDLLEKISKEKEPPIINLTIGTTFDGATDSVDKTLQKLKEAGHEEFYIHCDAALLGGIIPFLGIEHELDFRKKINSISISAHKFFGIPFPSGIFLSTENPPINEGNCIDYLLAHDTTIAGSRNGQTALFLWALIEHKGHDGFRVDAIQCIENAKYLMGLMESIGYQPRMNANSNIVTFKKPPNNIIYRWQLAIKENTNYDNLTDRSLDRAHIVVMPHVTKEIIDLFFEELRKSV